MALFGGILTRNKLLDDFAGGVLNTPVQQTDLAGSIPFGQLSEIGEAIRTPEELAQLGASIPVPVPIASVQPGISDLLSDGQTRALSRIMQGIIRGGLLG